MKDLKESFTKQQIKEVIEETLGDEFGSHKTWVIKGMLFDKFGIDEELMKEKIKQKECGQEFLDKFKALSDKERKEFIAKAVSSAIATMIIWKALFGDE